MKYTFLIFFSFFVALHAGAQLKEKPSHKKVAQDFKSYYNKEDYESLYKLLSPEFQKRMTVATFKGQLQVLKFYVEEIKNFKFVPTKDTVAYKFDLGDGNFLAIAMKPDLKINQLALERPKEQKKETINNDPSAGQTALYKGSKNNTSKLLTNRSPNDYSDTPTPLSKFKNLEMPKDNGMVTGKIMVRAKIDRKGKIITATAGAKGTTLADTELYRACEKALLKASFEPVTDGPEFRTVLVPFTFKIK